MQTAEALGDQTRRLADRAGERVSIEARRYEHDQHQPLGGYVGAALSYGGACLTLVALSRLTGRRPPPRFRVQDIALGALACHKFARIVSKDAVTSPVRAPFTQFQGPAGASEVSEEVRGTGVRHAVGELISCPFCLAPWVATSYVGGLALAPRPARAWAAVFSVVGLSDMLQHVYTRLRVS